MAEPVAGESSPQQPTNKSPWEAGFWGRVGEGIDQVKEALLGPSSPAPEPPKSKTTMPWDAPYWEGKKFPKQKPVPTGLDFKTDEGIKAAMVIKPGEVMPDTQSVDSNLAEIEKEIRNTSDPAAKAVLMQERAKLERSRNGTKR